MKEEKQKGRRKKKVKVKVEIEMVFLYLLLSWISERHSNGYSYSHLILYPEKQNYFSYLKQFKRNSLSIISENSRTLCLFICLIVYFLFFFFLFFFRNGYESKRIRLRFFFFFFNYNYSPLKDTKISHKKYYFCYSLASCPRKSSIIFR